jgi:hypothetical protein
MQNIKYTNEMTKKIEDFLILTIAIDLRHKNITPLKINLLRHCVKYSLNAQQVH